MGYHDLNKNALALLRVNRLIRSESMTALHLSARAEIFITSQIDIPIIKVWVEHLDPSILGTIQTYYFYFSDSSHVCLNLGNLDETVQDHKRIWHLPNVVCRSEVACKSAQRTNSGAEGRRGREQMANSHDTSALTRLLRITSQY